MHNHFGLLGTDVMPIFMIIALDIVITLRFSVNCSVVICSPTVIIPFLREASSETYGPRVHFLSYKFPITLLVSYLLSLQSFTFHSINPKIPKTLLCRLSISIRSHIANNHEGIDNPFIAWLHVGVCLCRY